MRINITQEDIEKGVVGDSEDCPIALAVHRAIGGLVIVDPQFIRAEGVHTKPSRRVRQFIVDFDDGKPVAPFAFQLAVSV